MKFKIDENLSIEVASLLKNAGHNAMTVPEQRLTGSPDSRIVAICQEEERILVTLDTGFADIRNYPPNDFSGLVVLRLKRQDKPYILDIAKKLVTALAQEPVEGKLWIVEENQIRIRT